jgi:adenylate cyclase
MSRRIPSNTYAGPVPNRCAVGVPILLDEQLIGAIGVVRTEAKPFTEEQMNLVQTFADQAAIAIANARLIDAVERQRTELARFVSPAVAELLSSDDGERLLAGHRAYITVLFADLRGFTSFVETVAPEELFDVLRDCHALVGRLVAVPAGRSSISPATA